MPMSGKFGCIHADTGGGYAAVSGIKNWNANKTMDPKSFAASNTLAAMGRRSGLVDWSASFERLGCDPGALLVPGLFIGFKGLLGPTSGVKGTVGPALVGPAIITNIACTWNWETNDLQQMSYNVAGNGELILTGTETIEDDSTATFAVPSSEGRVDISTVGGSFIDWTAICVTQAVLTLTNSAPQYSNSCVAPFIGRRSGLGDWTLALTQNTILGTPGQAFAASLLVPGTFVGIRIYNNATTFWELLYGHVGDISNINVNPETGEIISYTHNIAMSGDSGVGTAFDGKITTPDTAVIWGTP